jgi:outer membrane protein assembly factor BamB
MNVGRICLGMAGVWMAAAPVIASEGIRLEPASRVAGELPAYRIDTPAAVYYLEKSGAGLARILDRDGRDWLSFDPSPGSRAGGEYRGFPNAVHDQGGSYFHPMNRDTARSETKVEHAGPERVTISAVSGDGRWSCRYDFYASHCSWTMTQMPPEGKYWVLYEGTPGGQFDDTDWWMTSSVRERQPMRENHQGAIPAPSWIAFGDGQVDRVLFLLHHQDDRHPDHFYAMDRKMTVFGFGRQGLSKHLDRVPQSVSLGFLETTDHAQVNRAISSLLAAEATAPVESPDRPVSVAAAPERATEPTTASEGWPHWRGPRRNAVVSEDSGWDAGAWPPRQAAWQAKVGIGGTSPVVLGQRLFVLGWADGRDTLHCLATDSGREIWKVHYEAPKYGRHATGDEGLYAGITATPEVDPDTGRLYTLGVDGHLACWQAADGREVWRVNLYDTYRAGQRPKIGRSGRRDYGYTASPLIHGDWLIVEVGAERGTLIAFDKQTGREVWASQTKHQAGHTGSPVPITVQGIPCVAVLALKFLLVVRLDPGHEGETLAEYPWETEYAQNIATPAVWENRVLITGGYNHQAICMLEITQQGARKVWEQPSFSLVCSPVIHDGRIYWVHQTPVCLDLETGRKLWEGPRRFGDAGSCIITSDDRWILWTGRGDLVLAETAARSPGEYRELARTATLFRNDVWPHVVLADRRLYCKDRDGNLFCFALASAADTAPAPTDVPHRPDIPLTVVPKPAADRPPLDLANQLRVWPGTTPDLVVAWQREWGAKRLVSRVSEDPGGWKLQPRDAAGFDPRGSVKLEGGAMLVQGPERTLLEACTRTGELTVEVRFFAERNPQTGPARIVSFSQDGFQRNFSLVQEGDQLLLRLRTPETGDNGMNPQTTLLPVAPRKPMYVVVTYRPGKLDIYQDGRRIRTETAVRGDFRNWTPQHLLLGNEYSDPRPWLGQIERFAIHSRAMEEHEVRLRDALVRGGSE